MEEQETTIFDGNQVKNEKKKGNRLKTGKWVKVGSGSAVLLGGVAILSSFSPDETDDIQEENDIKEPEHFGTDSNNGESSFDEAFAEARAAQGPGGVFTWHGNQYSTYLKEEWDAMTSEQQEEYTEQAVSSTEGNTEVSTEEDVTQDTNATNTEQPDQTVQDTNTTEPDIVAEESNNTEPTEKPDDVSTSNQGGNEVEENGRFDIDENDVPISEDGPTANGFSGEDVVLDPEDILPFEDADVVPEEGKIVDAEDVSVVEDDKTLIEEVVEYVNSVINPNGDEGASEPEVLEGLPVGENEGLCETDEDVIPDSYEEYEKLGEDVTDSSITQEIEMDMPDYMPDANL